MISTSEIKVSCVIDEADCDRAIAALCKAFDVKESGVRSQKSEVIQHSTLETQHSELKTQNSLFPTPSVALHSISIKRVWQFGTFPIVLGWRQSCFNF